LITGYTDGIGLVTVKMLVSTGHSVLPHGRSSAKLEEIKEMLFPPSNGRKIKSYLADLLSIADIENFAQEVVQKNIIN
jgi:short-subunit dehydrogenase